MSVRVRKFRPTKLNDVRFRTLSVRHKQVATRIALGYTTGEIAHELGMTTKGVETHRHRLFKLLGASNQMQVVWWVLEEYDKRQRMEWARVEVDRTSLGDQKLSSGFDRLREEGPFI